MNVNLTFIALVSIIAFFIFIFMVLSFRSKATVNGSISLTGQISYPIKSLLLFVGFQVLLFPLMILMGMVGYEAAGKALHYIVAIQSFVTTTLFNYLVYGKTYPAVIGTWFLVGIPLHVIGGYLLGRLLQNRFVNIKQGVRLWGSLIIFETTLTIFMTYAVKSTVWLDGWHLPSGW